MTGVTLASLGADALANVTGAPYGITASNALGNGLGNYTISYAGGSLSVAAADIIVSANGGSSIYGQSPSNPGLSANGLKNGQDVDALTGLSNLVRHPADDGRGWRSVYAQRGGNTDQCELSRGGAQRRQLDRHTGVYRGLGQWRHIGLWQFAAQSWSVGHRLAE